MKMRQQSKGSINILIFGFLVVFLVVFLLVSLLRGCGIGGGGSESPKETYEKTKEDNKPPYKKPEDNRYVHIQIETDRLKLREGYYIDLEKLIKKAKDENKAVCIKIDKSSKQRTVDMLEEKLKDNSIRYESDISCWGST